MKGEEKFWYIKCGIINDTESGFVFEEHLFRVVDCWFRVLWLENCVRNGNVEQIIDGG